MTERELLRFHIEAVWNLTLPAFDESMHELVLTHNSPPWLLYLGTFAQENVTIWHSAVAPERRMSLLEQAEKVDVTWDAAIEMRREVVFHYPVISSKQQGEAQQLARILTAADADLINTSWPEEAPSLLDSRKAPCVGVIVDGRLLSVAHSSRQTPSACELGIDTLPEARRQGHATAAVTLWTAVVQQQGLIPIYSAFAENTASLRLAQATGYLRWIDGVYGPAPEDAA